jgi:hypothetical protein
MPHHPESFKDKIPPNGWPGMTKNSKTYHDILRNDYCCQNGVFDSAFYFYKTALMTLPCGYHFVLQVRRGEIVACFANANTSCKTPLLAPLAALSGSTWTLNGHLNVHQHFTP